MGEDCPEKIDVEFLRYIWRFRKREQDRIEKRLVEAKTVGKQVIWLKTRQEVKSYLALLESNSAIM
ncbi:hypothetical protein [Alicyclobacillus sp. ALC3]|uniref:hypothetical protein n=1 Tax=Alicyclobacillus sp. ALC3 TaxID=2796143 RepID=UPI0023798021|nr:hypothetical protein [Alicyclobacillus sp. ALC3]WDL96446.1 hypothetical protein JC200_19305 [Alicyclobacillus sp. ALC3]